MIPAPVRWAAIAAVSGLAIAAAFPVLVMVATGSVLAVLAGIELLFGVSLPRL